MCFIIIDDVEEMVVTPGTATLPLKRPLPGVDEGFEPAPLQKIVKEENPRPAQPSLKLMPKVTRLPVPCPLPLFTTGSLEAAKRGGLKGNTKLRLLREAATYYNGICPWPTAQEYAEMAKTICDKYPQLKDKMPLNGEYWVCDI